MTYDQILDAIDAGREVHVSGRIESDGSPPRARGVIEAFYSEDVPDPATGGTRAVRRSCDTITPSERQDLIRRGAHDDGFFPSSLRCTYSVQHPGSMWDFRDGVRSVGGDILANDPSGTCAIDAARTAMVELHARAGHTIEDPTTIAVEKVDPHV